jgi:hypothetical protein
MNWINGVALPGYSPTYQGAHNASRNAQQGQINSGVAMWNGLMAQQAAQIAASNARYSQLENRVVGGLRGANKSNLQDIADKYVKFNGQMQQDMIDSGLGNTSVLQNARRSLKSDATREFTASKNKFADTIAGYRSKLGSQAADAERAGILANSQLGAGAANWLSGISIGYPDPGAYANQSAYGAGGGGGGGAVYPALQGLHRFASDVQPMTYDAGGGGGYASLADQSAAAAANPYQQVAAQPNYSYGGAGGDLNYGTQSSAGSYDTYGPYMS